MCSSGSIEKERHPRRVALLYKRGETEDERLLGLVERHLLRQGHHVFVDRELTVGVEWAKSLERELTHADFVVVLLSAASAASEMLQHALEITCAAARQAGAPRLVPVRVGDTGPLPD